MRVLLIISGALALIFAGNGVIYYRTKRLAQNRQGTGFENFAAYFWAEQIPRDKLRVVYNYFQDWQQPVKDFPVHATDDLYKVYGICEEDLDDAVIVLAEKWRVSLPASFEGVDSVHTVADLVRLLARLPYGKDDTPI